MRFTRRRTLAIAGTASASALLAGCLESTSDDTSPAGDDENDGDDGENDDGENDDSENNDGENDSDDMSIDGRLHNDDSTTRTFEIAIRDSDDELVTEDSWDVEAGASTAVPGVGKPGTTRTFEVTVGDATATETLTFDVENTPEQTDGYVDVRYTEKGTIDISFTPADDSGDPGSPTDHPMVDEPPYEITDPGCGDDGSRDPLWLCENMPDEPTIAFSQETTTSSILVDEGLTLEPEEDADAGYYAALLTDESDLDRIVDRDSDVVDFVAETDFVEEAVLVVQTGWGSGSKTPHVKRIEATDGDIHAFGCQREPCIGTDDYTVRTVVARFERPDALASASVSLTVSPEARVNFGVSDGIVTLD